MRTHSPQNNDHATQPRGHSLLVTVIILALLGALGVAGLHVANLNMRIAANERDARDALYQADSGVNIGSVFLEEALNSINSSFYDDGSNATNASAWQDETAFDPDDYPCVWNREGGMGTYVRCGMIGRAPIPGTAVQIGTGYEGAGHSASLGGVSRTFLIRAHRIGRFGSQAEVDLGWEHVIQ